MGRRGGGKSYGHEPSENGATGYGIEHDCFPFMVNCTQRAAGKLASKIREDCRIELLD